MASLVFPIGSADADWKRAGSTVRISSKMTCVPQLAEQLELGDLIKGLGLDSGAPNYGLGPLLLVLRQESRVQSGVSKDLRLRLQVNMRQKPLGREEDRAPPSVE